MMTGLARQRVFAVLSVAFALAPFVFGSIRPIETGSVHRMLWMAVTSAIGALALGAFAARKKGSLALGFVILTLAVSTMLAGLTGYALGARGGPGVWMVAFVLGICWTISLTLFSLSRSAAVAGASG
jgi:hypothetical protein